MLPITFSFSEEYSFLISFLNPAYQIATERELSSFLYTSFGRFDPRIRQFWIFTFPESENLHSSENQPFQGIWDHFSTLVDNAEQFFSLSLLTFSKSVTCEEYFSILFAKNVIQNFNAQLPLRLQYEMKVADYHQIAVLFELSSLQ